MKRIATVFFLLPLIILAETLSLEKSAWRGNPLTWQAVPGGFKTIATGHTLEYVNAPLSENAEVEAVVTVEQRLQVSYSISAVALVQNAANFYHLALGERPLAAGGGHFIELHQKQNNAWPKSANLTVVSVESPNMDWQYGVPYRMKLSKHGDTVTGTVTTLDGKLCYKRVVRFREGAETPVNFVRPAIRGDLSITTYTELNGSLSGKTMDAATTKATFPPYECDSFIKGKTTTPTGFFQVKQDDDGSWLAYDPLGRGFLALGMGSVRYNGQACERLQNKLLYKTNNDKKYKSPKEWEENTRKRLFSWGFNTFYGDASLRLRGLSRQHFLSVGTSMASLGDEFDITPYERKPCSAFPNVYHPDFKAWCEWRIADICGDDVDNPWVFGYFADNELAWWGRGASDTGLFDAALKKPAAHHAKIAIRDLLLKHADGKLENVNKTWGLELKNADELLEVKALPAATQEQRDIKLAFLRQTAERYFKTIHDAFRKIDPNHLLLGCRFAGIVRNHPVVLEEAGKYSDVVTWNSYITVDLDDGVVYSDMTDARRTMVDTYTEAYGHAKKPIMITEWSFPALDSGLPCTHGAGQRFFTQAERAKATDIFARTLLSMPFAIGYDYFMWVDEPALGIRLRLPYARVLSAFRSSSRKTRTTASSTSRMNPIRFLQMSLRKSTRIRWPAATPRRRREIPCRRRSISFKNNWIRPSAFQTRRSRRIRRSPPVFKANFSMSPTAESASKDAPTTTASISAWTGSPSAPAARCSTTSATTANNGGKRRGNCSMPSYTRMTNGSSSNCWPPTARIPMCSTTGSSSRRTRRGC